MIVEFAGIPGSGKSTAAAQLLAVARERGLDARAAGDLRGPHGGPAVVRRPAGPASRVASIVAHPRLTRTIVAGLRASRRSRAEKWYAFRHVSVTVSTLRSARLHPEAGGITVLHEGICQRAFLLFVDGEGVAPREITQPFLLRAPRPDVVVVLRVPPEVALARISDRDHGALSYRFDGLSPAELRWRMEQGQRFLLEAAETLASTPPAVRTIVLDAHDLDENLRRLEGEILPPVRGSATRAY